MSFDQLGLSADLLRAVKEQGYDTPSPIQARSIPSALAGKDLLASAQTGTGKTAAFTLPLLDRLTAAGPQKPRRVRALVLTPTRELAVQVTESVRSYGKHLPLKCTAIYGGVGIGPQIRDLERGTDILVATPGRLMDHMQRGTIKLDNVDMLVMDEADRMLDMGFLPAIERIVKTLPKQHQTLLFSATFSPSITKLANRFLNQPEVIETAQRNAAAAAVDQSAFMVDSERKRELLTHLIGSGDWRQVLVFTRTKRGADKLAKQLEQDGIRSTAIHGNKSQAARNKALKAFKHHNVRALIATDVAARGIDIDHLPYVVNFDIPTNPEDYVHRIGRTGRAGQEGNAISLVCADEARDFAGIRKLVNTDIPAEIHEGFEPQKRVASAPKRGRGNGQGRPPRRPRSGASTRNSRAGNSR
ncbi:DEAD/DEAH box helicase [Aquisalimonas asiatica]|uniref:DEAD-box ATP-dependent RNA helicase RhpA n=1 Tax=Aquisalimonas asiatica TaxID=406100 RepID=A0A1H8Q363_9GAMM|nr:DEAD/DEAH box helicase [Aquisalimonas asiatica]SEO48659.1 ATP-dependent RNA helicase RhlE [Aquisalimonas asiatica]